MISKNIKICDYINEKQFCFRPKGWRARWDLTLKGTEPTLKLPFPEKKLEKQVTASISTREVSPTGFEQCWV